MLLTAKDICREFHHNSGTLTRVLDQLCLLARFSVKLQAGLESTGVVSGQLADTQ